MRTLFIDLETFSSVNLKTYGQYLYTNSIDFEILIATYALDDGPVQILLGEPAIRETLGEILLCEDPNEWRFVAHNANFERLSLGKLFGKVLHPRMWWDTMALAKIWGYRRSLNDLAKDLQLPEGKQEDGRKLIDLFCKPRGKAKRRVLPYERPEEWERFLSYAKRDTELLQEVDKLLPKFPSIERNVWVADALINDRGVLIDRVMVEAATIQDARNKLQLRTDMMLLTGLDNPNSGPQLHGWLAIQGFPLPDLTSDTVTEVLSRDDVPSAVRETLLLRQELALAATAKFPTALKHSSSRDPRVHGAHNYHAAHTGRWGGRYTQFQNLPRKSLKPQQQAEAIERLLRGDYSVGQAQLKMLVRAMVPGPITQADYAGIEARVLAWAAGEAPKLESFRRGEDLYVSGGIRMGTFGERSPEAIREAAALPDEFRPDWFSQGRQDAKTGELGCGFGGGIGALYKFGYSGTEDQAQHLVDLYRHANPEIVRFWYALKRALMAGGGKVGQFVEVVTLADGTVATKLPSGRFICYRNFSRANGEMSFRDPERGFRKKLWHGLAVENTIQGIARDLLAAALIQMLREGLPVMAHIHDEVLVEGDYLEDVSRIMGTAPSWAPGLPLVAEGKIMARYGK